MRRQIRQIDRSFGDGGAAIDRLEIEVRRQIRQELAQNKSGSFYGSVIIAYRPENLSDLCCESTSSICNDRLEIEVRWLAAFDR